MFEKDFALKYPPLQSWNVLTFIWHQPLWVPTARGPTKQSFVLPTA